MSMSMDEINAFLSENRLLRLASNGADDGPRVVPLAFLCENQRF